MGMESQTWHTAVPNRIGKQPSWDNFSTSPRPQTFAPNAPSAVKIIHPPKNLQHLSHMQRQAQDMLNEHSTPSRQDSLWPVYGIFLFAFGMLGYVSYNLMY
ncbi:conserved hypothetical protein [Pseudomonas sp. 8Z]|uniref:hypothetical protein n=1 Tax=Pseudomonas sp. 8Z TaxID=2653166 RepID=UPI0012F2100E|nr:hypothetical protein [Pseudomonas sp. 8Z]VXC57944.1 conserved hypothetical protein [Pseudomonas sp. 8Z]